METNMDKFKEISKNAEKEIYAVTETLDKAIADFVKDAGGKVEILENSSESCMLYYIDDESYDQVENVYINDDGKVMVETNHTYYTLSDISVNNKLQILDWMIDQVEDPEYYGIDQDEDWDEDMDEDED